MDAGELSEGQKDHISSWAAMESTTLSPCPHLLKWFQMVSGEVSKGREQNYSSSLGEMKSKTTLVCKPVSLSGGAQAQAGDQPSVLVGLQGRPVQVDPVTPT